MSRQRINPDINAAPPEAQTATEKREPGSCNIGPPGEGGYECPTNLAICWEGSRLRLNATKPTYTEKRAPSCKSEDAKFCQQESMWEVLQKTESGIWELRSITSA